MWWTVMFHWQPDPAERCPETEVGREGISFMADLFDVLKTEIPNTEISTPRSEFGFRISDFGFGFTAIDALLEWLFGVLVLIVALAFLAALPLLQFLSLGY